MKKFMYLTVSSILIWCVFFLRRNVVTDFDQSIKEKPSVKIKSKHFKSNNDMKMNSKDKKSGDEVLPRDLYKVVDKTSFVSPKALTTHRINEDILYYEELIDNGQVIEKFNRFKGSEHQDHFKKWSPILDYLTHLRSELLDRQLLELDDDTEKLFLEHQKKFRSKNEI